MAWSDSALPSGGTTTTKRPTLHVPPGLQGTLGGPGCKPPHAYLKTAARGAIMPDVLPFSLVYPPYTPTNG